MTKVEKHFRLQRPLDEALMEQIAGSIDLIGVVYIKISPSREDLLVAYDATRLRAPDVEAALERAWHPCRRRRQRGLAAARACHGRASRMPAIACDIGMVRRALAEGAAELAIFRCFANAGWVCAFFVFMIRHVVPPVSQ